MQQAVLDESRLRCAIRKDHSSSVGVLASLPSPDVVTIRSVVIYSHARCLSIW